MSSSGNILDYTLASVKDYTAQSAHSILDLLIDDGIATKREKEKDGKLYIGQMSEKQGLSFCLSRVNDSIKNIEKWEFDKTYRYSMLFEVYNFNKDVFEELVEKHDAFWYDKINEYEELYPVIQKPSIVKDCDNGIYTLKFNLRLDATDAFGNNLKKRYSVLSIFYTKENLLEIRFDGIAAQFSKDKFYFAQNTLSWIRTYMKIGLQAVQLFETVDYIKRHGNKNEVVLSGQDMLMASGGKATIDIGNNDKELLPFIGELKAIMEEYADEFDKAPELKTALDDFIYEKENLSEFPWVKFRFGEKVIEVKFTFNYSEENGCLLQHLYSPLRSNQGRERMDYVTNYIIDVRNIIAELPDDRG